MRMMSASRASNSNCNSGGPTATGGSIFVYGTLMSPEVMNTLLGPTLEKSQPVMQPAILCGYQRFPVKNHVFPGLIPAATTTAAPLTTAVPAETDCISTTTSIVQGIHVSNLSLPQQMDILDWFEGDEYTRVQTKVQLLNDKDNNNANDNDSGKNMVSCELYEWSNPVEELELERLEWDYDYFREQHLEWYLENTVRPCSQELKQRGHYNDNENYKVLE